MFLFVDMCQPVSYTYPDCSHLVAAPHVWIPDPCAVANKTGRWCHISPDYPLSLVERRPWVGRPLEPCEECARQRAVAQRVASNEAAFSKNKMAGSSVSLGEESGADSSREETVQK